MTARIVAKRETVGQSRVKQAIVCHQKSSRSVAVEPDQRWRDIEAKVSGGEQVHLCGAGMLVYSAKKSEL